MPDWRLILRTGFGNVFAVGRWDHEGVTLIADAYNTGDWSRVAEYARLMDWDDRLAN